MKKLLAFLLIGIMISTESFALCPRVIHAEESDDSNDEIPLYRYVCENCNNLCEYYCTHETIYDSSTTHKTNCTKTIYKSRLMIYCDYCGMNKYVKNSSGGYAYHYCIESHTKCTPHTRHLCSWY